MKTFYSIKDHFENFVYCAGEWFCAAVFWSYNESGTNLDWHTTSNRRQFDINITSIRRRPKFDEFSRHFHVLFWCNFADWKIRLVSTYFFRRNFAGQKIHLVSAYFLQCNFAGRKIHVVPTYLFRRNFDSRKIHVVSAYFLRCNSLVEKPTFFPRNFFDIILIVEKSTLFARTFFGEISMGKNSTSFLVKMQANKNIRGDFLLLVTLKSWLLKDCSH